MLKGSDESFGFCAAQSQQVLECDAELSVRITAEILLDQRRREPIEAGGHRGVRGKEVAGTRDGQRDLERLPGLLHEAAGSLQHRERGMAFVQVADFRLDARAPRRSRQPPIPSTHLLLAGAAPGRRRRARW